MGWRRSSGFVGRVVELGVLEALVERVVSGTGGVVLLAGEPGIGKTRLAAEAADHAAAAGLVVAWGRCRESEGAPALWPWVQILRQLGLETGGFASLADSSARLQWFEMVGSSLVDVASRVPLLLVLDDVHRADEASLRLLGFVGDQLWPAPVGLVVAYREVEVRRGSRVARVVADLARTRWSDRCALRGLDRTDVGTWLDLASDRDLGVSADEVHERTGGNPLFVAEVVRLLMAGGPTGAVPPSVQEVIAERLNGLPPATRLALEVASVLGRDFEYPALAAALGTSPTTAIKALDPAVSAQLITADDARVGSYRFVHALVCDGVEAQLAPSRRAELHAKAFTALRDTGWGLASDLAHHAVRARPIVDDETAVEAVTAAADEADRLLAWEDAADWWRTALAIARRVSGLPDPAMEMKLGHSLLLSGRVDEARERFESVAASAARTGDDLLLAASALAVGDTVSEVAADARLLALLDQALRAASLSVDDRVRLAARRAIATYWIPGGQTESRRRSADAVRLAQRAEDTRSLGAALIARQFTLRGPDVLAERIEAGEAVLAIAEQVGDDDLRFRALQWLVPDRFQAGDLGAVGGDVESLAAIAETRRNPLQRWRVLIYRGLLAGFAGQDDDAERLAEEAFVLARRLGQDAAEPYRVGQLTRLYWRTDRLSDLEPDLRAAVARFPGLPTLQCDLALVQAGAGDTAAAVAVLERLTADSFAVLPRDSLYLASLAILGEVAVTCCTPRFADGIIAELEPYAERNLIQGVPVGWGSAAWHLARLHHLAGRHEQARRTAEIAEHLHLLWRAGGLGHPLADLGRDARGSPLSPREVDVIRLLATGSANKEIATTLSVSVHTVERHVANIFLKLDVRNRSEATTWAHRRGLVS